MRTKSILTGIFVFLCIVSSTFAQQTVFTDFVKRSGDQLVDENGIYKFISFNIPCLHYNEDYMPFTETSPWRLTDEFEISDALDAVVQCGGQVVRTYALSVRLSQDSPDIPRHIDGIDQLNEEAFKTLDKVLELANQKGIRIIIPLIDNWKWWGGAEAYAQFRSKSKADFWNDPQIIGDFKKIIELVINRKNTYTGVKYKDDKAILAWETGNELVCPQRWTTQIAQHIKSLDPNHLVIDGYHTTIIKDESVDDPYIDILTTHHYSSNPSETIQQITKSAEKAKGKKPYFVGEFGFIPKDAVEEVLDCTIANNISGALIWSLRFRCSEGGFYWHSEPLGDNLYKAYHWPGFATGNTYEEKDCLAIMQKKAFQIRGLAIPPVQTPKPPYLLPIENPAYISFRGSVGAESYIIERSLSSGGEWTKIAENVDETFVQHRPIFNDTSAKIGQTYSYRVLAKNSAGVSQPSNIQCSSKVFYNVLTDEMSDFNLIYEKNGRLDIESKQARVFKEEIHRLHGLARSSIIYKTPNPINSFKIYSFWKSTISDFEFSVSADGMNFVPAQHEKQVFYKGSGDYSYYKPVLYEGVPSVSDALYLKIEYTADAWISRVEVLYAENNIKTSYNESPVGFVKGFSWGWTGYRGQYLGDKPADSMKKLAQTNSDWVCISFGGEMLKFDDPNIYFSNNNPQMITDEELLRSIKLARENNLKVILKPVVNVRDGTWRAWIKFNNSSKEKDLYKWEIWWNHFEKFIIHYAQIAQQTKCEMLCLGCEMESTEEFEFKWRNLIAEVRRIYSGPLTYNCNHGRETRVTWWDAVDIISVSAYYPVGTDDVELALADDISKIPPSDSSIKKLKERWIPIKNDLKKISKQFDKPILFIELGLCSARGCSAAPWTHQDPNMIYDADEQARYYQSAIETFWDEPWFIGFTWWAWLTDLYTLEEAKTDKDFCIYGKPAEKIVREWYKKSR